MGPIHDALLATEGGKKLVVEVAERIQIEQERHEAIGQRIRQLKELAYDVFVRQAHRKDAYNVAKAKIRGVGVQGGTEYNKALMLVKYMLQDKTSYREAMEYFGVPRPVKS